MSWPWKKKEPTKSAVVEPLPERVIQRMLAELPYFPPLAAMVAMTQCLEHLHEMEASAPVDEKVIQAFSDVFRKLPRQSKEEFYAENEERKPGAKEMTVPLYDLLDNCGKAIMELAGPFCGGEIRSAGLFIPLRKRLLENEAHASKANLYDPRRKIIGADEYDAPPEELIRLYLAGTPFYDFFHFRVPFKIPRKTFASHGIILAPPNHGKTQLLGSLIAEFLTASGGRGLFVLDPHGDLFHNLSSRVDPARLITLDPDTNPPPLNFLDFGTSTEAQTLQTFSYLMSSLSGGLSDKQGAIVPYLLKLLRQISRSEPVSIETLRLVVDEKVKNPAASKFASAIAALPTVDQGFFHNQFYSGRMQETKDAIGWKLYSALSNDTFREMFSATKNSFDADAAMRERKVVLVKGSENTLGEAGAPIFLQFVMAQFMAASFRRANIPKDQRHLCILFVDEAKHVFNDQTERILTECRKWNLGFMAATQLISQIPENVRTAIYGATAIKITGPVAANDANQLAREMYCKPEFIRDMSAVEGSHAEWAFHVTGLTEKRSMRVRCPYGVLEAMPQMKVERRFTKADKPDVFEKQKAALTGEERPPSPAGISPTASNTTTLPSTDDIPTRAPGGWKKKK